MCSLIFANGLRQSGRNLRALQTARSPSKCDQRSWESRRPYLLLYSYTMSVRFTLFKLVSSVSSAQYVIEGITGIRLITFRAEERYLVLRIVSQLFTSSVSLASIFRSLIIIFHVISLLRVGFG